VLIDSTPDLKIKSLLHDYDVSFDPDFSRLKVRLSQYDNSVVVIDKTVSNLFKADLGPFLHERPVYEVDADEQLKTLAGVTELIEWLLKMRCNRSTTIVSIGGGIVQDLVTFTSNIFYRGTKYVLVPTTLLSMSDSCIGAKCGINFRTYKNQLGVMHSPRAVHINTGFLKTLEDIDVASGYGEILKLSLTGENPFFVELVGGVNSLGLRGEHCLGLIRKSLETKRTIIEVDEYETDLRRILNYGHTFGHALEALTGHAIPHGLAVAWGIDVVNYVALDEGLLAKQHFDAIHDFILEHLTFSLAAFPSGTELVEMARRDKKMANGVLNMVLLSKPGDLGIYSRKLDETLIGIIDSYLESHNVYGNHR